MSQPTGNVHGTGDFDFKTFFLDIPPVTRTVFMAMFTCTLLSGVGLIPVDLFVLEWYPITRKLHLWRLALTFLHAGRMGLNFLIRMYFLYTYSQQLENGTFFGRTSAYAWFLTIVSAVVLAGSTLVNSPFNGGAWLIAIIHLWGRHANNLPVTMYGFIKIPAKYLSLAMLGLDLIISGGLSMSDALGLLAGHVYYFLDSVYPTMPDGKQLISVPVWFERLIDQASNSLGSATGLQRGPPGSQPSTAGSARGTSGPAGSSSGRSGSTGFRSGLTVPGMRSGYTWGQGHTLGS